jgi:hypothetical protein
MKANPKRLAQKLAKAITAWKTVRPTKTFSGMTLDQFIAKVQPSLDARDSLESLKTQTTTSRTNRLLADAASNDTLNLVINAVKGDAEEGENGPLYAAMGYVPKNQRRSGLTRKGQTTTPVAQTAAATAATATTPVK